jgi:arsenate reductase-like glutaredoxin family protein
MKNFAPNNGGALDELDEFGYNESKQGERGTALNIQIFGKSKCFDTKKAERYFKERRIRYQMIDVPRFGMSRGELSAVIRALGGLDAVVDDKAKDAPLLRYLAYEEDKLEKLLEQPELIKTPVVRNGKLATVGYQPDVWRAWEEAGK